MPRTHRLLALAALALAPAVLAPAALAAQARPYVLDRSHSAINFVADARLHTAHGYFKTWDAEIALDADAPQNSRVAITIDVASIDTRVEGRDRHLRSKDFFNVDSFPKITFVANTINKLSETKYNLTGDLTIRGVTKTITVPTTVMFFDKERGDGRVKGEFVVNRHDYGVSFRSANNLVLDEVKVEFDMHLMDKEKAEARRRPAQ